MTVPKPKVPLGTHCSAIRNNTLYTFSESAFQSLELKNGSEWQTLPHGVGTRGAACVIAHRNTADESLYIVGGSSDHPDATIEKGFKGLQRWIFSANKWETVQLPDPVTFNITNHGAAFLESTQRLIVFAGTAFPAVDIPSANTFLIQTAAPHEILAMPAKNALLAPIVLPWDQNGALVVGGNGANTELNTYTTTAGWTTLTAKLSHGMKNRGQAWASTMDGDDGSRRLIMYDMSVSPATVDLIQIKEPTKPSKLRRRRPQDTPANAASAPISTQNQLTASNWPVYNGTLAPTSTRTDTALAYDGDMVIISGGDDASPLLFFNARTNSWVPASSIFNPSESSPRIAPSDPTITTPNPAPEPPKKHSLNTIQSLFLILGCILLFILLLAFCLWYLKKRKQRVGAGGGGVPQRTPSSLKAKIMGNKNDRLSFQDRGTSFMKETGVSNTYPYPYPQPHGKDSSDSSASSPYTNLNDSWLNIQRAASQRGPQIQRVGGQGVIVSHQPLPLVRPGNGVVSSSGSGVGSGSGSAAPPATATENRGSGWSKYFSGTSNTATNLAAPQRVVTRGSSVYSSDTNRISGYGYHTGGGGGAAAGTMGVVSVQRTGSNGLILPDPGLHERRNSDVSLASAGDSDLYGSEMQEKHAWSNLDGTERNNRGTVASSVYDSRIWSRYESGPPSDAHQGVDNLSWLNLKN
ncbi:hypothetical protein BZA77DRAFT_140874 [Pyronema omphalodes]|nr:hypothetical protein BZA77DRAFT_140874 [Pyronema omphalodes]